MPKNKRLLKALNKSSKTPVLIDDNFPDLSKDPVFLAKHEKAEKFIAKYGLPESFKKKTKSKKEKRSARKV